jgi:hypothetical protein
MAYIFLDESGDLGFSEGSSKYLVITLLVTDEPLKIARRMKKIKQHGLKKKYRKHAEFKKERIEVGRQILRHIIKEKFSIYTIITNN